MLRTARILCVFGCFVFGRCWLVGWPTEYIRRNSIFHVLMLLGGEMENPFVLCGCALAIVDIRCAIEYIVSTQPGAFEFCLLFLGEGA